jgi:hypothetical protein
MLALCGILYAGFAGCGAVLARSAARGRLEVDEREVRIRVSPFFRGSPMVAIPLPDLLFVHRRCSGLALVTRTGVVPIADHFDAPLEEIQAVLSPPGSPGSVEELISEQRLLHPPDRVLVREEGSELAGSGWIVGAVVAALAGVLAPLLLLDPTAGRSELLGLIASTLAAAIACGVMLPTRRHRRLLAVTPDWLIVGDEVRPAGLVRGVWRDAVGRLAFAMRSGGALSADARGLEVRIRRILRLLGAGDDPGLYADEAAATLGLSPMQFRSAAATLCADEWGRYRRDDVEALRRRLR